MKPSSEPLFLARETYRRRRLMDGARILPFLGGFAFLVPTLWAAEAGTAAGMFYLFFVWIVLIGLAWLLARRLMSGGTLPTEEETGEGD